MIASEPEDLAEITRKTGEPPPLEEPRPATRVGAIDAYRGAVMLLMMAEVLEFAKVAAARPGSSTWSFLALHQTHVDWSGMSLHDMIQPSFSFLVGVALPFSLASRERRGGKPRGAIGKAAWRALVLILLGVFLRSVGKPATNWTFEDTLTQIGLGYLPLVLIGLAPVAWRYVAVVVLLVGYWGAFALWPAPGPEFDYAGVGVPADWPHHATGLASHWNKNSNLAMAFDRWFLNLFPRQTPFAFNRGGYATLSFIPTLATMVLGLLAGGWLIKAIPDWAKLLRLALAGGVCLGLAWLGHHFGLDPIVKRIWTPGWALASGGVCFLALAVFYLTIDVPNAPGWSFPLRVVGMNSIAAYVIAHLTGDFLVSTFRTHLGDRAFRVFGAAYEPLLMGGVVLTSFWLILSWMDRRGLYLRV